MEVDAVLDLRLPVGADDVLADAADELDLAVGRAVDEVVDAGGDAVEVFRERGPVGREAGEHEAAIAVHARHAPHRVLRRSEVDVGRIALPLRDRGQHPVRAVGPTVIGAAEQARVAALHRANLKAAVRAAVEDDVDSSFAVARHQNRLGPDPRGNEVVRCGHLGLVADEHPRATEDLAHLEVEDRGVRVDAAVDAIGAHQGAQRIGRRGGCRKGNRLCLHETSLISPRARRDRDLPARSRARAASRRTPRRRSRAPGRRRGCRTTPRGPRCR